MGTGDGSRPGLGSRSGSRTGARTGGNKMTVNPDVAAFSLANQDNEINEDFEEMKSETD